MQTIETIGDIEEATAALVAADRRLGAIAEITGLPPLRRSADGFAGMCSIVVSQQVSRASADAIFARFSGLLGTITPQALDRHDDAALVGVGLSRPKIRTLRAVSAAVGDGTLDFARLRTLDDEGVMTELTAVKGIGPWTADVYLLSYLGRPDAFPAGDLALQEAARIGLALEARPSAAELTDHAEPWRPWRAVAARLLWSYYRVIKREETGVDREQGGAT